MSATKCDLNSWPARPPLVLALLATVVLWLVPAAQGAAAPRDIVLMLDNSGSMRKNDPQFLTKVAVRTFLERLSGDNSVAVVAFDQGVRVLMPLTPLNDETRARFLSSLDAITYNGLLTNSPAGLERSMYELRVSGRPGAEKSIVFMTDGIVDVAPEGPDAGDVEKARWMKSTLADEVADNQIRIFGIAFTDNADFELIQTLAKRTGGEYYRAYTAPDIDGVLDSIRSRLSAPAATPPPVAVSPPSPAPTPPGPPAVAGTTAEAPPPPVTPAPETALPPAPDPPKPDAPGTAVTLPEAPKLPIPEAGGGALPQVSLPEVDLPKVTLPQVNLGGTASPDTPPGPAAGTEAAGTDKPTPEAPIQGATAGAGSEGSAAPPAPQATPAAQPAPAAPAPPVDSTLFMALIAGGAALVLALAAVVIVAIRRRPAPARAGGDGLMPKAFLNDIGGVTSEKSYELGDKPTIVGRLAGPDTDAARYIVIDESTVGRRHALIEYKEHSFWVADQNSLNGTFVNNSRIEEATRLKHGDRIRFHKHEFEFLVLDMFETDRTMMSETVFADLSRSDPDDDDATVVREGDAEAAREPSPEDPTVTRP